jgi:deoxyribonuclease V
MARHAGAVVSDGELAQPWPGSDDELIALQEDLGPRVAEVLARRPWRPPVRPLVAGCFVAFARGEAGPGAPGDRAWAAAAVWRAPPGPGPVRRGDEALRGRPAATRGPRQASDVVAQAVVSGRVPAAYTPGLLARREGPVLAAAVSALTVVPDVVLVDATGADHPRRAGLAVHLGAALGLPTVGVTHRGLVIAGEPPAPGRRGDRHPVHLGGVPVAAWVCTRSGARPVLVHAGWRTDVDTAVWVVLASSTEAARTPVPLQEARRVAREARALAGAG